MWMPGAHAGIGVRFDDVAAEHFVRADAAVVAALRRGKSVIGPAERTVAFEERVLLLDAEPRIVLLVLLGDLRAGARACCSDARCRPD